MRVLVCGEFSQIHSGYAVYGRELLNRLSRTPGVEVAEMASICGPEEPKIAQCNWRVYPVTPSQSDKPAIDNYLSNPLNAFGREKFGDVCLDFKPTHVLEYRDSWNGEYQYRHALRPYYAHIIMPAIDAIPQHRSWIDMYATADKVLSYTDWGCDVLREAGLKNVYKSASPCSSAEYRPYSQEDKQKLKDNIGLGDINIVGTVMRNQGRKLFPDLFKAFSDFIIKFNDKKTYLLCHTSYPDSWEFDELLHEHGIQNRVLFTYSCRQCENLEVSFYSGAKRHCKKCNSFDSTFTRIQNGASNNALNMIYNMMDVYVQYANGEGFGIPLAEAASCGLPVMATDYSAMSDIIQKCNGTPINVKAFRKEPETGRMFAVPDGDDFGQKLHDLFSLPKSDLVSSGEFSRLLYGLRSYDDTVNVWLEAIKNTRPKLSWNSPNRNFSRPDISRCKNMDNLQFVKFLINDVLQEPSLNHSYIEARLIRDLTNGYAMRGFDGKYYHEDVEGRGMTQVEFTREISLKHFLTLLEDKTNWETRRVTQ